MLQKDTKEHNGDNLKQYEKQNTGVSEIYILKITFKGKTRPSRLVLTTMIRQINIMT